MRVSWRRCCEADFVFVDGRLPEPHGGHVESPGVHARRPLPIGALHEVLVWIPVNSEDFVASLEKASINV